MLRLYGKMPNKKDLLQNKLKVRLLLRLSPCFQTDPPTFIVIRSGNISIRVTMPSARPEKPQTSASPISAPNTPSPKTFLTSRPLRPVPTTPPRPATVVVPARKGTRSPEIASVVIPALSVFKVEALPRRVVCCSRKPVQKTPRQLLPRIKIRVSAHHRRETVFLFSNNDGLHLCQIYSFLSFLLCCYSSLLLFFLLHIMSKEPGAMEFLFSPCIYESCAFIYFLFSLTSSVDSDSIAETEGQGAQDALILLNSRKERTLGVLTLLESIAPWNPRLSYFGPARACFGFTCFKGSF